MKSYFVFVFVLTALVGSMLIPSAQAGPALTVGDWAVGLLYASKARLMDSSGTFKDDTPSSFSSIIGMAVGPDGDLYIVDSGSGNRIMRHSQNDFDSSAAVVTGLSSPQAITFGPDGDLYIAETGVTPNRISRYQGPLDASPFTLVSAAFATGLAGDGGQTGFQDLTFGPDGNLYISNWKTAGTNPNPSIEQFDGITGGHITTVVAAAEPNVDNIRGMTIGPNGDIYAASYPASGAPSGEILRYAGPGSTNVLGTFESIFVTDGQGGLDLPQVPRFGSGGDLYVTGFFSDTIERYQGPNGGSPGATIGNLTTFSGGSGPLGLAQVTASNSVAPNVLTVGDWFVGLIYDTVLQRHDSDGVFIQELPGLGSSIIGLAVGPDGNVYTCHGGSKIRRHLATNLQSNADVITGLLSPQALTFGPGGDLYVAETDGSLNPNRVKRYAGPLAASPFTDLGIFAVGLSGDGGQIGFQDLAFGSDGNLYVSNWKTGSTSPGPSIEQFDGVTGSHNVTVVAVAEPNLDNIRGMTIGPNGDIYACNYPASGAPSGEIVRYAGPGSTSSLGTFVSVFVSDGLGTLDLPQVCRFGSDGNLYVTGFFNDQITRYQGPNGGSPGAFVDVFTSFFGGSGAGPIGLAQGTAATTPPSKTVVTVGDWFFGLLYDNDVQHHDSDGDFIQELSSFNTPIGIACGPDGDIYVVDNGNSRITRHFRTNLAASATVVSSIQAQAIEFGPDGDLYVLRTSVSPNDVQRYQGPLDASPFTAVGTFATGLAGDGGQNGFQDIAFGPGGNMYISNWRTVNTSPSSSIERFDGTSGSHIDTLVATSEPNLDSSRGMTIGPNGDIYVANADNDEVVRYQGPNNASPGTFVSLFVSSGSGGLDLPQVPRFGSDGNLYVSGFFSDRIHRYQGPNGGSPGAFVDVFTQFSPGGGGNGGALGVAQVCTPTSLVAGATINVGDWFLTSYYDESVKRFDSNGNFIERVAMGANALSVAVEPLADGNVYACDTGGGDRLKLLSRNNVQSVTTMDSSAAVASPAGMAFTKDGFDSRLYMVTVSGISQVHRWLSDSPFTALGQFSATATELIGMQDIEFGPDGNLYVANWKTVSGGLPDPTVERFNGSSGAHMGTFVANDANLDNITGMAFGPDGNLYIGNKDAADGEILAYQGPAGGSPGTFISIFTPTGNKLGLTQDLDFGNDGDIYCANWFSNTVTRYQGPTNTSPGTFIDTFIQFPFNSSGSGSTHGPFYLAQVKEPIAIGTFITLR